MPPGIPPCKERRESYQAPFLIGSGRAVDAAADCLPGRLFAVCRAGKNPCIVPSQWDGGRRAFCDAGCRLRGRGNRRIYRANHGRSAADCFVYIFLWAGGRPGFLPLCVLRGAGRFIRLYGTNPARCGTSRPGYGFDFPCGKWADYRYDVAGNRNQWIPGAYARNPAGRYFRLLAMSRPPSSKWAKGGIFFVIFKENRRFRRS